MEYINIKDLCSIKTGKLDANASTENGKYPFFTCAKEPSKIDTYAYDCSCVLLAGNGEFNVNLYSGKFNAYQRTYIIEPINPQKTSIKLLYYIIKSSIDHFKNISNGGIVKFIKLGDVQNIKFPDINFDQQQKMVSILDTINNVIDADKKQLELLDESVKSRFIEMFGTFELNKYKKKMLKETCNIITGNTPSRENKDYYGDYIEWIKTDNIVLNEMYPTRAKEYLSEYGLKVGRIVEKNAILMACIAGSISSIGRVCITNRRVAFNQQINAIVHLEYNPLFLYIMLQLSKDYLVSEINMAIKGILSKSKLEEKAFIVPSLELQNKFAEFVKQIDESKLIVQKHLNLMQELLDKKMEEFFGGAE